MILFIAAAVVYFARRKPGLEDMVDFGSNSSLGGAHASVKEGS